MSFFSICIPLTFICFLIAIARTSSTILNKYGERGQPCLVPYFTRIASRFSPFSFMLATGLLNALTMFSNGHWILVLSKTFNMKECWILSNAFSASNEMIFFFLILYVVDYIDGFPYIEPSLHSWEVAKFIMVNDHFNVFLE